MWTYRKTIEEDLQFVSDNAKAADVEEVLGSSGRNIFDTFKVLLRPECCMFTALYNEEIVGIFGWEVDQDVYVPYAVTTYKIYERPISFMKFTKKVFNEKFKDLHPMSNLVSTKHTQAVRWLGSLGFTMVKEIPWGLDGQSYYIFERD